MEESNFEERKHKKIQCRRKSCTKTKRWDMCDSLNVQGMSSSKRQRLVGLKRKVNI